MSKILYQVATDKFYVDFEGIHTFPAELLDVYFAGADRKQISQAGDLCYVAALTCTEAQWATFLQFRRDCERDNPQMYAMVDNELNNFLVFAAKVRPGAPCALN